MKTIGVYLHIPFCKFLCHYCDFVKTAHWDDELVERYFDALQKHCKAWIEGFLIPQGYQISSVFVGGGTPSLFTRQYKKLLSELSPFYVDDVEITLEANPGNLSEESVSFWKEAGFNRLSLGAQSFCSKGLKNLTRQHGKSEILKAYKTARPHFDSINLDLIYGWKDQNLSLWEEDLSELLSLRPDHVSLYLLTYASKTPMGRAHERGRLPAKSGEELEAYYTLARKTLGAKGYHHEEVSNWSLGNQTCKHNWLYWQDGYYIGIGAGACGYLPSKLSPLGIRYEYTSRERSFCQQELPRFSEEGELLETAEPSYLSRESRQLEDWLLEYIGAGLRCKEGLALALIEKKAAHSFQPTAFVKEALENGDLILDKGRIKLNPKEWFRESAWCLKIFECFSKRA